MTLFSVIIPTRNRPEFLGEAVASVLAQNCRDLEVLIVNDGADAVARFADDRVQVLDNQQRGAVTARNLGVEQSRGKYIAFLDDDDVWCDGQHLAKAFAAFDAGAEFYFADGKMVFPNGSVKDFAQDADVNSLARDNTILISAVCYEKRLHDMLGRFDEALPYYWDWDWYLRVARSGARLQHGVEAAVNIRVHAQNMSGDTNFLARRANLDLLENKHELGKITLKNHLDFV